MHTSQVPGILEGSSKLSWGNDSGSLAKRVYEGVTREPATITIVIVEHQDLQGPNPSSHKDSFQYDSISLLKKGS